MSRSHTRQPIEHYLSLHYPIVVHEDPDGGYVAEFPDLPGCATQAETPAELFQMIDDAKRAWIEATYEDGREIPLPRDDQSYSGRFVARVPVSLHRRLAEAAEGEGVSLNQYVVHLLGIGVSLDLVAKRIEARLDRLASRVVVLDSPPRTIVGAPRTGSKTSPTEVRDRGRRRKQRAPASGVLPKVPD